MRDMTARRILKDLERELAEFTGTAVDQNDGQTINLRMPPYNAPADGLGKTLASRYATLADAQVTFKAATSLSETIDGAALRTVFFNMNNDFPANGGRTIYLPDVPGYLADAINNPGGLRPAYQFGTVPITKRSWNLIGNGRSCRILDSLLDLDGATVGDMDFKMRGLFFDQTASDPAQNALPANTYAIAMQNTKHGIITECHFQYQDKSIYVRPVPGAPFQHTTRVLIDNNFFRGSNYNLYIDKDITVGTSNTSLVVGDFHFQNNSDCTAIIKHIHGRGWDGAMIQGNTFFFGYSQGTKEVQTLTITAGATAAGTVNITLDGTVYPVILDGTEATPTDVATKIRAQTYTTPTAQGGVTGWTDGGSNAVVTFTSTSSGDKTGTMAYNPGTTGAAGSIVQTTQGSVQAARDFKKQCIDIKMGIWIQIQNNQFFEPGEEAVRLDGVEDFKIQNNHVAWSGQRLITSAFAITNPDYDPVTEPHKGGAYSWYANGVQEVLTLTITAGATSAGNVTVTLDGVPFAVALDGSETTSDAVAAKIRAASFPGWRPGGGSGSNVTIRAMTIGNKTGTMAYSPGTTGAAGSIVTTTNGSTNENVKFTLGIMSGNNVFYCTEHSFKVDGSNGYISIYGNVTRAEGLVPDHYFGDEYGRPALGTVKHYGVQTASSTTWILCGINMLTSSSNDIQGTNCFEIGNMEALSGGGVRFISDLQLVVNSKTFTENNLTSGTTLDMNGGYKFAFLNMTVPKTISGLSAGTTHGQEITLYGNTGNCTIQHTGYINLANGITTLIPAGGLLTLQWIAGHEESAALVLSSGATSAGTITVTLNGTAYPIVLDGSETTAAAVATKIRAGIYTDHLAAGTNQVVTFNSTKIGTETNATYDPGTTGAGVAGDMVTVVEGDTNGIWVESARNFEIRHVYPVKSFDSNTSPLDMNGFDTAWLNFPGPSTFTVTGISDGYEGKEIVLRGKTGFGIIQNSTDIRLAGGANAAIPVDGILTLKFTDGDWYEKSRNFTGPRVLPVELHVDTNQGILNVIGYDIVYLNMLSGTTVTGISDGEYNGKEILLVGLNPNATITHIGGGKIRLKDGKNATIATDGTMRLKYIVPAGGALSNGYWIEVSRNFTRDRWGGFTGSGNGSTTVFNIPHGMPTGVTPSSWNVTPSSSDAGTAGIKYVTADSTNLIVTFATAPVSGTNNVDLRWRANANN